MANPTLNWTINRDRGTIFFGRLLPLTGNTYDIELAGGDGTSTYTFYVMDDGGEVCLARSSTTSGVTSIAFTGIALRDRYAKDWHEVRTFHCVVSDSTNTIAEGDLPIIWNPVWTEPSAGEAYTMRGPQGVGISAIEFVRTDASGNFIYQFRMTNGVTAQYTSPRGPIGPASNANYVKYAEGEFYQLKVYKNRFGEAVVELDQTPVSEIPEYRLVTLEETETISGQKTMTNPNNSFTGSLVGSVDATGDTSNILVKTQINGDNSTKAASTAYVDYATLSEFAFEWVNISSTDITVEAQSFSSTITINASKQGYDIVGILGPANINSQYVYLTKQSVNVTIGTISVRLYNVNSSSRTVSNSSTVLVMYRRKRNA